MAHSTPRQGGVCAQRQCRRIGNDKKVGKLNAGTEPPGGRACDRAGTVQCAALGATAHPRSDEPGTGLAVQTSRQSRSHARQPQEDQSQTARTGDGRRFCLTTSRGQTSPVGGIAAT